MHYFILETNQPLTDAIIPEASSLGISRISMVSKQYKYDIEAHSKLDAIVDVIVDGDNRQNVVLTFNPLFFPDSLSGIEDIEEEFAEELKELDTYGPPETGNNVNFMEAFDPSQPLDYEPPIVEPEDLIQCIYILNDDAMEYPLMLGRVILNENYVPFVDFENNVTVH